MVRRHSKIILWIAVLLALAVLATACGGPFNQVKQVGEEEKGKLVIYSNRNERFVQNMLDKFAEDTGIEVVALHGANPLQLEEEARNPQADIFISNDLGALGYLSQQGLLAGGNYEGIESIPESFRADDNSFFAISVRARGLIYNKDLISEAEMPKSAEDLFDPKWADVPNGYAITRGGNGGMIGHISALRYEWGDEKTVNWISVLKEHAAGVYQGHGEIRRAVGAGEHAFGLVNNYYYHQQLLEPQDNNVGFIYLDQEDGQMGAVANAAGVGLVKGGPNQDNAVAFLTWLFLPENQVVFVGESLELLINAHYEVQYPEILQENLVLFSDLKIQSMPVKELGNYFADTTALIEQSGLDIELR